MNFRILVVASVAPASASFLFEEIRTSSDPAEGRFICGKEPISSSFVEKTSIANPGFGCAVKDGQPAACSCDGFYRECTTDLPTGLFYRNDLRVKSLGYCTVRPWLFWSIMAVIMLLVPIMVVIYFSLSRQKEDMEQTEKNICENNYGAVERNIQVVIHGASSSVKRDIHSSAVSTADSSASSSRETGKAILTSGISGNENSDIENSGIAGNFALIFSQGNDDEDNASEASDTGTMYHYDNTPIAAGEEDDGILGGAITPKSNPTPRSNPTPKSNPGSNYTFAPNSKS